MQPRYKPTNVKMRFLGQAGPLDVWLDEADDTAPYLVVWGAENDFESAWATAVEDILRKAKTAFIAPHLTLHDECILHQLCNKQER